MEENMNALKNNILKFYQKYMIAMGIAGHFIFIFQTYEMVVHKSASNVSLEGFAIAFLSIVSWLFYGYLKRDSVLIKVNLFGVASALVCISVLVFLKASN